MERTWRWFGKNDKITLAMLKQIGVEGIVTALHDVPLGEVWTREKIRDLREYIEQYGMRWSVVESLPVVETIREILPEGGSRTVPRDNYRLVQTPQVFQLNMVITSILILCVIAMALYQCIQFAEHLYKKKTM